MGRVGRGLLVAGERVRCGVGPPGWHVGGPLDAGDLDGQLCLSFCLRGRTGRSQPQRQHTLTACKGRCHSARASTRTPKRLGEGRGLALSSLLAPNTKIVHESGDRAIGIHGKVKVFVDQEIVVGSLPDDFEVVDGCRNKRKCH